MGCLSGSIGVEGCDLDATFGAYIGALSPSMGGYHRHFVSLITVEIIPTNDRVAENTALGIQLACLVCDSA